MCTSNLSLTWTSPDKAESITKDVPCFTKPTQRNIALPTFPGEVGSPTFSPLGPESWKIKPSKLALDSSLSESDDPSGLGSGSDLPWPSSYPTWLAKPKVDYKDMFTETEDVLIWGGSDRLDLRHLYYYSLFNNFFPGSGLLAARQDTMMSL